MKDSIVNCDSDLISVIEAINSEPIGTAFLIDDSGKFRTVFTDGDLRRLLLENRNLPNSIPNELINRKSVFARSGEDIEQLMAKTSKKVKIIPILDEDHNVVDYFEYRHKTNFYPVAEPSLKGNEHAYLNDALASTWISSRGKYIDRFENDFARFTSAKFGISTSNGTVAIHLALKALGVGAGDEVIVPDLTFAATINAVIHAGATPVIVDVREDDWTIDPVKIREAVSDKTKAVIPVHIYGQPCEMDSIMKLAEEFNFYVVEDCAEAHGATYNGSVVGSIGHISCFSFFGNKIITTGEGGMCLTNDPELDKRMRLLRDHGMNPEKKYWHEEVGYNYRMTNLQAAIGCAQLEKIDEILQTRENIEAKYKSTLNKFDLISWQKTFKHKSKVVWLVSVLLPESIRDRAMNELAKAGIDVRPFFYPLSDMPIYQDYVHNCKVSKKLSRVGLNLPTIEELDYEKVLGVFQKITK